MRINEYIVMKMYLIKDCTDRLKPTRFLEVILTLFYQIELNDLLDLFTVLLSRNILKRNTLLAFLPIKIH